MATRRVAYQSHYATIAAIISAAGSAIGSAAATAGGAALGGLGTAATALGAEGAGAALGSAATGLTASGAGALGSAGTAALGGAIPAGVSFAGPGAALTAGESAAMLPTALATPASFGGAAIPALGAGPPTAAAGGMPSFGSALQSGMDLYSSPGKGIGGQVGKLFGNEELGGKIGQAGQLMAQGNQKPQEQGIPMPAQALSIAAPQASPLPGMGSAMGGSGPSFHVNPATGILEYS